MRIVPLLLSTALTLSAAVLPSAARATTMYAFSPSELTYVADLVAEAEVESVVAEREEASAFIKSVATLRLTRVIKGEAIEGDVVPVREWGGVLGDEVTDLPGAPIYVLGERVLVYLERENRPDPLWRTVGMSQGKFTLVEERDTGRDVLVKLRPERTLTRFVESAVVLPAVRRYCDQALGESRDELARGFVPAYARIPGLPQWKDDRFQADAVAAGQVPDARWGATREGIRSAEATRVTKGGGR